MNALPFDIDRVGVPPIKCQGIKTRLVPFIFRSIKWSAGSGGRWIEPFVGSGVVALNLAPPRALLADTNQHIIGFYRAIQSGEMNGAAAREYLVREGTKLAAADGDYYYRVRDRFNQYGSPFDFLFLNRACFNGLMRFNQRGEFNTPYGHKPKRFSKAYVTKIVNQIVWAAQQMEGKDWEFRVASWDETLREAQPDDFVYMDPPYIGRHADYYNSWDSAEAERLAVAARSLPSGFALSMWLQNRHRRNQHIADCWSGLEIRVCGHFYHVGSTEELRGAMDEALIIKPGYATPDQGRQVTRVLSEPAHQLRLAV